MSEERGSYHHGNLRAELLVQAHSLLREGGPDAVSLRQVAASAGVSRTAPYHHFRDKEALIAALVQRGFEELVADLRVPLEAQGDAALRFEQMGSAYVRFALREPHLYKLMFGPSVLDRERHPETACAADAAFQACAAMVAQGQATGEFNGTEPVPVALAAWSTVHGLASLLIDMGGGDPAGPPEGPMAGRSVDQILEAVLRTLSTGMRVR
jgi:AcrR family transcriptional regulator